MELGQYLYVQPQYTSDGVEGFDTIDGALEGSVASLSWDPSSLLSMVSFGYLTGDRTLISQISRTPWMGSLGAQGGVNLATIPSHGRKWGSYQEIAGRLQELLFEEARSICRDRKEIYLLLSGGLDSRIIAGIVSLLHRQGELLCTPVAVTWGIESSRDVIYGREIAKILGFSWQHLPLESRHLLDNVESSATLLGAMISPVHLHRMTWFKSVSSDALVIAASYGDSVGRGEFSGRTLLELKKMVPTDRFGLLSTGLVPAGMAGIASDFENIRERSMAQPAYVAREYERQGFYMRSLIGHAMSLVGQYCRAYQMFTHPKVYSYIWSIHPSLRTDHVYAALLDSLHPDLAAMPWARTNRALKGVTSAIHRQAQKNFHQYKNWIQSTLYDEIYDCVQPEWFADRGIFRRESVRNLAERIRRNTIDTRLEGSHSEEVWIWMASLRLFCEHLERTNRPISVRHSEPAVNDRRQLALKQQSVSKLRRLMRRSPFLRRGVREVRRFLLRRRAIFEYPPQR